MKIALIGTHGTGKTTLAHKLVGELKERGMKAGFLGELAGTCPLQINEKTTKEAQEWIIYNQNVKEIEGMALYDPLICDRSILDGYVYYNYKFGEDELLESIVKNKIKNYDFLFRVPINPRYLQEDGIRSINPKFQKDIDKKFDYLIDKLTINCYTTNNLNEMLQIIKGENSKEFTKHCLVFSEKQADMIFKEIK